MTALARKITFKSLALSLAHIQEAYISPSSLFLFPAAGPRPSKMPSDISRHSVLVTVLEPLKGWPTVREWKWDRESSLSAPEIPCL